MFAATSRNHSTYSSGRNRLEAARWIVLALRGVGRRRDDHVGQRIARTASRTISTVAAVAADQAVGSDQPHVAGPGDRLGWRFGDRSSVTPPAGASPSSPAAPPVPRRRSPRARGPGRPASSSRSSAGQHLLVPPGVHRELVVRDDICPPLRLAEVVQHHHRHLREAQLARSQQTTVAGDDPGRRSPPGSDC